MPLLPALLLDADSDRSDLSFLVDFRTREGLFVFRMAIGMEVAAGDRFFEMMLPAPPSTMPLPLLSWMLEGGDTGLALAGGLMDGSW